MGTITTVLVRLLVQFLFHIFRLVPGSDYFTFTMGRAHYRQLITHGIRLNSVKRLRSITHMDKWTDIHTFYPGDTNREGTINNKHIHTILFKQVTEKCAGFM